MGKQESKLERPSANVINEVEVNEQIVNYEVYLIIITVLLAAHLAIKLYSWHKKTLKKTYMARAASVAQI